MTVELDDYEVRNLVWLLELIHSCYLDDRGLNTGDWVGQIKWKLSDEGYRPGKHQSNVTIEQWLQQWKPQDLDRYQKWEAMMKERDAKQP